MMAGQRSSLRRPVVTTFLALCFAACSVVDAKYPGWTEVEKLLPCDRQIGDSAGASTNIQGDFTVVGAPDKDNHTGAAYLFQRDFSTWNCIGRIDPPDVKECDAFGAAVMLQGNTVLVGAPGHESCTENREGRVFVFRFSGYGAFKLEKIAKAVDGHPGNFFGAAMDDSGCDLVIGATGANVGSVKHAGAAYIYKQYGFNWVHQQKVFSINGTTGDNFGASVAIDGRTVLVGAPLFSLGKPFMWYGAAFWFEKYGKKYYRTKQVWRTGHDWIWGRSGTDVALWGNVAAVSRLPLNECDMEPGGVMIYRKTLRSGKSWRWDLMATIRAPDGFWKNGFGSSIAIKNGIMVIGASAEKVFGNSTGAAYIYRFAPEMNGNNWWPEGKIYASDWAAGVLVEEFGASVALSEEGIISIGCPLCTVEAPTGAAYIFEESDVKCFNSEASKQRPAIPLQSCSHYANTMNSEMNDMLQRIELNPTPPEWPSHQKHCEQSVSKKEAILAGQPAFTINPKSELYKSKLLIEVSCSLPYELDMNKGTELDRDLGLKDI